MANLPSVQYDLIKLGGGLDQVTPTLSLSSGVARRAANFECAINGGYTRIAGYERFDGRPSPSDALYTVLRCDITGSISIGDTVVGGTSGATGEVIEVDDYAVGIDLTKVVGTFTPGEELLVGGSPVATLIEEIGVDADGYKDAEYLRRAADVYRQDIGAVPGSGPVRGVALYKGIVYAWRDNAAGTQLDMYKSSTGGWVNLPYYPIFYFDTGSIEFFPGDTITGGTSGASAEVLTVVVQSGDWSTSDAVGYAVFTNMVGTPTPGEAIRVDGIKVANNTIVNGNAYLPTAPLPGGRIEAVVANFGGGLDNRTMYYVDGNNTAFAFDDTTNVATPIFTGMPEDTPTHVAFHKQHLFLSFGPSLQFSGIGDPFSWSPLLGAGEIAMNDNITNLIALPGDQSSGALGVYTRSDTSVLYGTSALNFSLSTLNTGTGGVAYTSQNLDQAYALDDRGVISLGTSLNFGNFLPASLTMNLRPFLQQRVGMAVGSSVNRNKGQYRVFFSDGTGLYMTIRNGELLGTMPIQFLHAITCVVEAEDSSGVARSFFGSENGYVYEMDRGASFDGENIQANMNLVYNSIGGPRVLKRFRKASVELTGDAYAEFAFGYDLGYRTQFLEQPLDSNYTSDLRGAYWDEFTWDTFVWDAQELKPTEVELYGTAENIAIRISTASNLYKEFTVNNIILHYTQRRGIR